MARPHGGDGLQRLLSKQRTSKKSYVSIRRQRSKRKAIGLNSLQRVQLKLERQQRAQALNAAIDEARDAVWEAAKKIHAEFQCHSADYFSRMIMQSTRIKTRQRRTSRWNAYLSQELQGHNDQLPEGTQRSRVSNGEVTRAISEKWNAMSREQQADATEDAMKQLEERHESHKKGTHTVQIQSFHDARATIETLQREVEDLHARTGTEILMFAVRSDTSAYNQPFSFATSQRLSEFVKVATSSSLSQFALKLEGYCVSGMQGVAQNYMQGLLNLKKDAAELINKKLQEASTRGHIGRMCYVNFVDRITVRAGIVVENWPLRKFCAPGEICSRPELETLVNAWTTGAARFRSMDDDEWGAWKLKHYARGEAAAAGDTSTTAVAATTTTTAIAPVDVTTAIAPANATTDVAANDTSLTPLPSDASESPAALASHNTTASVTSGIAPPTVAAVSADVPARKCARGEVTFVSVDVITGPDGRSLKVSKRPRKARKGKQSTATTPRSTTTPIDDTVPATADTAASSKKSSKRHKKASTAATTSS